MRGGLIKATLDQVRVWRVELWNVRGDVVSLRATVVIAGVRRRKMTSALPDRAERKQLLHRRNREKANGSD